MQLRRYGIGAAAAAAFVCFASCQLFTTPLFHSSRDFSAALRNSSTESIVQNIPAVSADPDQTAALLEELGKRDQDEIVKLPVEDKESILAAATSAALPVGDITDAIQNAKNADGSFDTEALVTSLCESGREIDTTAVESILNDTESLAQADVSVLAFSAAAVALSALKEEASGGSSVAAVVETLQTAGLTAGADAQAIADATGFSLDSARKLETVLAVAAVLSGTAGDGEPDRREDAAAVSVGGFDIGSLLDGFLGN